MSFVCNFNEPTVQTKDGKLHGFKTDDTYQFRGIKYAEAERFMPPTPVRPWEGVKDASLYGYVSPTIKKPDIKTYDLMTGMRYWPQDEACQYLNIWTGTLDKNAKKPVMFWIHGGGLSDGSPLELEGYDGTNLCRNGDVVVVSVGHRLNILGYFNLSNYGEKYALSGTVGMLDLVMALQWVHDNIANFGGDPDNVTIFGQSGGGLKTRTLMQMPAAENLFHKAIMQSGINADDPRVRRPEDVCADTAAVADAVVSELGLARDTIDEIQKVPYEALANAYLKVLPELRKNGVMAEWSPVPNASYPGDPMMVGFSEKLKKTPVLVSTVISEQALHMPFFDPNMPESEKIANINKKYGDGAEELMRLFKETYPDKNLINLMSYDSMRRKGGRNFLDLKSECSEVNSYSCLITYDFDYNNGLPAWHGADLPLVFNTPDTCPVFHEPGARRLAEQVSASWAAFAHNGDPNNKEIPTWIPYKKGSEATMIFDKKCEVRIDHDRELVELHHRFSEPIGFPPM